MKKSTLAKLIAQLESSRDAIVDSGPPTPRRVHRVTLLEARLRTLRNIWWRME